jgi:hypothetical protein
MTLSATTNESRSPITHEKTETRFKEVLRRSLGNLFNHCLEFYLDTRVFSQRIHSTTRSGDQGVYPKQGMFVHPYFSAVRTVLARPRYSFKLTETSSHGNLRLILARPRSSFGLTETSAHSNIRLVLACPRSSLGLAEPSLLNDYFCNNAHTGLHCHFLWVNRDIYALQHTACLGPLKELIKIKPRRHLLWANRDIFA